MSNQSLPRSEEESVVNLTIEFGNLTVSVRGAASEAADFVRNLAPGPSEAPSAVSHHEPLESEAGYSVLSAASASSTRGSIEASFTSCPTSVLALASRLSTSGTWSPADRIRRAWKAGQWAAAVLSGQVGSPNRTPTIPLGNRFYLVLRSETRTEPALFTSSREFFAEVGDISGTDTLCHGFPSESEARAYCAGAGIQYPSLR